MRKKILFLTTVFAATAMTIFAQNGACGDNLTWRVSNDTIYISGTGAMWEYNYSLSNPNFSPWTGYENLTTAIIGEGVTRIGSDAFYNDRAGRPSFSSLSVVKFPSTLEGIGEEAFYGCQAIADVRIPDGVVSIGYRAFLNTGWYDAQSDGLVYAGKVLYTYKGTLPDFSAVSATEETKGIADNAFSNQRGLTAITLPDGLRYIGDKAFLGCSNLPAINIPASVETLGKGAFQNCDGINSIVIPEKITRIEDETFSSCVSVNSVTLPQGVEFIGESAFNNCRKLTGITLPDKVKILGRQTFYRCYALETVTFPLHLTEVGKNAFYECTSLLSVELANGVTKLGEGCFSGCSKLASVVLPEAIDTIPHYAFSGCALLASVNLPDNVKSIGENAFNGCTSLKSIDLPDNLKTVGNDAFYGCAKLASVVIPEGTQIIGESAFYNCSVLKEVTIPASVTNIGGSAFGKTALKTVKTAWINPIPVIASVFRELPLADICLLVPWGTANNYLSAEVWKGFNIVEEQTASMDVTHNSATIIWPTVPGAASYTLAIYTDAEHIQLFNSYIIPVVAQSLLLRSVEGDMLSYKVEGLSADAKYYYTLQAFGADSEVMVSYAADFKTPEMPTVIIGVTNRELLITLIGDELLIAGCNADERKTVSIYDFSGRIVLTSTTLQIGAGQGERKINVSSLPKGVYIVKTGNYTGKLVKE
jgi:hypothetical protein